MMTEFIGHSRLSRSRFSRIPYELFFDEDRLGE